METLLVNIMVGLIAGGLIVVEQTIHEHIKKRKKAEQTDERAGRSE